VETANEKATGNIKPYKTLSTINRDCQQNGFKAIKAVIVGYAAV